VPALHVIMDCTSSLWRIGSYRCVAACFPQ